MEDRNWVDYYKDATREQIIAEVVHDIDYIKQLEHQLQSYKDREDKLRQLITINKLQFEKADTGYEGFYVDGEELLQILEGDDK